MTLSVKRMNPTSPNIEIGMHSGSVSASISEDSRYLRAFWSELGHLLEQIENERKEASV